MVVEHKVVSVSDVRLGYPYPALSSFFAQMSLVRGTDNARADGSPSIPNFNLGDCCLAIVKIFA